MKVVLTGAGGFLGWHTRVLLHSRADTVCALDLGDHFDAAAAGAVLSGADRVIHLAGVNRAADDDVREGNARLADRLAAALHRADAAPTSIAFANSTQVGNGSTYGIAKERAGASLSSAADAVGSHFVDVRLPNLFGEHGRPFYNSVTATFANLLAEGEVPTVQNDRELDLLHAQDAAEVLAGVALEDQVERRSTTIRVSGLLEKLSSMAAIYAGGEIPTLWTDFDRDLFNTYRSFVFTRRPTIPLTSHTDDRGGFTEVIRSHGSAGQASFSTTVPGVIRGQHYHRRKIERFTVIAGSGTMRLRQLLTEDVVTIAATGKDPVAVDMPTMWAHNISNDTDDGDLYTCFWANELFDPKNPDTFAEAV